VTRLRETAPAERASIHPLRIAASFGAILRERRFVVPYAALLCAQIGIFAFVSSSAFTLVTGLGVPAAHYSFMFAAVMLGQIAGSWASSRLVARLGTHRLIGAGANVVAFAGLAMAAFAWSGVGHWLAVIAPFMLYMFGTALIQPNATAVALSPFPRAAGAASSLMGATQFAVGAAVSTALGLAFEASARPLSTAVALAGAGSFLVEKLFLHGKR
jgi:DHA1 family bicyclomycin/chloramphenicol resistance-like MFS transporter